MMRFLTRYFPHSPSPQQSAQMEIISAIRQLEISSHSNELQFNMVTDDYLIDALIFERKALHLRYCYYLALARKYGVSCPITGLKHMIDYKE